MAGIIGIGTDIIAVSRIRENLNRHPEKFIERILSVQEKQCLPPDLKWDEPHWVGYVAKRFAGKEAFAKALGTGIANGISFQDISILNDQQGKPYIECTGNAKQQLAQRQIQTIHVSLSDEKEYAVAFVVLG